MAWWAWAWFALVSLLYTVATMDDLREGVPRWKVALDALGHAISLGAFVLYFVKAIPLPDGIGVLVVLGAAIAWNIGRTVEEMRQPLSRQWWREDRGMWIGSTITWVVVQLPTWGVGLAGAIGRS